MPRLTAFILISLICSALTTVVMARPPKKLLVVSVTKGFRHDSIETAEAIIKTLGESKEGGWTTDYVRTDDEMKQKISLDGLKHYDGVLFANTTGSLPIPDKDAFIKWLADGHAFIGMHSAADTLHDYRPYIAMLGGEFKTHGAQVEVECINDDKKHPATRDFGDTFTVFDEIYQFQSFDRPTVHSLLRLDKHPNDKTTGDYPIAWCKQVGKGRVFYTALGHRIEVWKSPAYQKHVTGGIRWALGLEKGDAKPQMKK